MLERLARTCYRRRRLVVVGWVVALIAFSFLASAAGGKFKADFRMPDTESQRAFDVLKAKFPAQSGDTGTIVYRADKGVNDPAVRQAMEGMFAKVAAVENVQAVRSPYQPGPAAGRQVAPDGKTA